MTNFKQTNTIDGETSSNATTSMFSTISEILSPETENQIQLLFKLKQHIDLILKQLNLQKLCLKRFGRFHRYMKGYLMISEDDDVQDVSQIRQEYGKFHQNYRYWQKLHRKISKQLPSITLYDVLYELYEDLIIAGANRLTNNHEDPDIEVKLNTREVAEEISDNNPEHCPLLDCNVNVHKSKEQLLSHLFQHSIERKQRLLEKLNEQHLVKQQFENSNLSNQVEKVNVRKSIRKRKLIDKNLPNETTTTKVSNFRNKEVSRLSSSSSLIPSGKNSGISRKVLNRQRTFPCPTEGCSFLGKSPSLLKVHQAVHTNERPFKCTTCGKCFKDHYTLKSHQKVHEGLRFGCSDCEASYSTENNLRKHVAAVHTKQAPIYRCLWPDCGYSPQRIDLLRKHRTVHTGERPFRCIWPDCEKTFKTLSSQHDHMSMHKNERKFKCNWPGCGYSCNLNGNLRKHGTIHEKQKKKKKKKNGQSSNGIPFEETATKSAGYQVNQVQQLLLNEEDDKVLNLDQLEIDLDDPILSGIF